MSKYIKGIYVLIFTIITGLVFIVGCGSSGSGGGAGHDQKDVQYTADCLGVSCPNADTVGESWTSSSHTKSCTWWCGNYKDQTRQIVLLTFKENNSGCWSLQYENIQGKGVCN